MENLNNIEKIKMQKDGLDIINDIRQYAQLGYEAISADDLERLKWYGLYEQRGKQGRFMLRVKLPSGILSANQALALAKISKKFGRGLIYLTTRQTVQFYWLRIENIPEIFRILESNGLTSVQASGDCPRTITGNPLAGIDPNELMDTTSLVKEVQDYFTLNKEFSNLPRKFKISISANVFNLGNGEINDLSFTPASKIIEGKEVLGFHVWVWRRYSNTTSFS